MLVGIAAAVLLQVAAVQTAIGNTLFGTRPLSWRDWGVVVAGAALILVLDEVLKLVARHWHRPAEDIGRAPVNARPQLQH
jgi:hypothetical protein